MLNPAGWLVVVFSLVSNWATTLASGTMAKPALPLTNAA
jgi:hypothetical protein